MAKQKLIYLIGRDNWQKDDLLNKLLVDHLKRGNAELVWEDPAGKLLYKLRDFENRLGWIPPFIRQLNLRFFQVAYGLFNWSYFRYLSDRQNPSVEVRSQRLRESLLKLSSEKELIILSRSAGGRFVSLIADSLDIYHIICIGYPFQHPDKEPEPERYLHLETLQTPMLIIQGDNDEYGGREIKDKYIFSKNIELLFVKASHDFKTDVKEMMEVLSKIDTIINS